MKRKTPVLLRPTLREIKVRQKRIRRIKDPVTREWLQDMDRRYIASLNKPHRSSLPKKKLRLMGLLPAV